MHSLVTVLLFSFPTIESNSSDHFTDEATHIATVSSAKRSTAGKTALIVDVAGSEADLRDCSL